jgi:hypothetical protein
MDTPTPHDDLPGAFILATLTTRLADPATPAADLPALATARNAILSGDSLALLLPACGLALAGIQGLIDEGRAFLRSRAVDEAEERADRRAWREQRRERDEKLEKALKENRRLKKELVAAKVEG